MIIVLLREGTYKLIRERGGDGEREDRKNKVEERERA